MTSFNQSECIISSEHNYRTLTQGPVVTNKNVVTTIYVKCYIYLFIYNVVPFIINNNETLHVIVKT